MSEKFSKKYSNINKAGFHIHKFIHNSKFNPKAILHTHSVNSVAMSCLREGFNEKLNQSSMRSLSELNIIIMTEWLLMKLLLKI